ncbi:MAG TPA: ParB N-terminal domain-containing protein [Allosphingosinicella sp.]|jgi:uncharacterized ParB-like nuclease family protein|nr:ParB N-terminal domain-containing protein [Allosphingosinicella sp.]
MSAGRSILSLPIAEIAVGERVGFFHPDHAARLGASIAAEGQHDPIHVRRNGNRAERPWTLVAGLHRLRGVEGIGRQVIDAIQAADASSDEATLLRLELSENLDHRAPLPIERAMFIAARAQLEEEIDHPGRLGEGRAQRAARTRWDASATIAQAFDPAGSLATAEALDWRQRTAAVCGCSLRTFALYLSIYRALVEPFPRDVLAEMNRHPLAESLTNLLRIVKLPTPEGRRRVIDAMLADPELPTMDAAFVAAELSTSKGNRPASDDFEARVLRGWDRMKLRQKRGVAIHIAKHAPPSVAAEMVQALRDRGLV